MAFRDVEKAFKQENLTPGEKYILIALADTRNASTKLCFPGYDHLSKKTGYSKKQVGRNIKRLKEKGSIFITKKETERGYFCNHYSFSWDKELEEAEREIEPIQLPKRPPLCSTRQNWEKYLSTLANFPNKDDFIKEKIRFANLVIYDCEQHKIR